MSYRPSIVSTSRISNPSSPTPKKQSTATQVEIIVIGKVGVRGLLQSDDIIFLPNGIASAIGCRGVVDGRVLTMVKSCKDHQARRPNKTEKLLAQHFSKENFSQLNVKLNVFQDLAKGSFLFYKTNVASSIIIKTETNELQSSIPQEVNRLDRRLLAAVTAKYTQAKNHELITQQMKFSHAILKINAATKAKNEAKKEQVKPALQEAVETWQLAQKEFFAAFKKIEALHKGDATKMNPDNGNKAQVIDRLNELKKQP